MLLYPVINIAIDYLKGFAGACIKLKGLVKLPASQTPCFEPAFRRNSALTGGEAGAKGQTRGFNIFKSMPMGAGDVKAIPEETLIKLRGPAGSMSSESFRSTRAFNAQEVQKNPGVPAFGPPCFEETRGLGRRELYEPL